MKKRKIFCALALAMVAGATATARTDSYEGYEITPEGAWCWFADPRAIHYENQDRSINSSYIGYIDVHGNIKATQFDFKNNKREEVLIRSYFQPDDHDNPTFLVLPDERVMIFYSRHTDEACFYYRVSQKKGDITTLGEEKKIVTKNNTTYPSPFILSDDPTHIYLCWRGIGWHPTIAKLSLPDAEDNVKVEWGPFQMVQSTGARPYAKYQSNGKDRIMVSYTTGHPDNEQPNYLYFNYINIKDLTLEDIKGNKLSTIANGPFKVSKESSYASKYPLTIVDKPSNMRDWLWQVVQCPDGNPAIAMVQISGGKTSHDYYYAKWNGTEWKKTFLINGGGHFHQTPNLEMCYSGGMAIDPANTNVVYCSAPVQGANGKKYEILKFTVANDGTVSREDMTKNSKLGNSRPFILPGSENSTLRLCWMYGNYYDWIVSKQRPKGYPTAIHCDYEWTASSIKPEEGLVKYYDFKDATLEGVVAENGAVTMTDDKKFSIGTVPAGSTFSISMSPYLSEKDYGGTIVSTGTLTYGVNTTTMHPYVKIGDKTYTSTNLLGTADCWTLYDRGTSGKWYTPTKLPYFNLTITYADGILTTYINGLIDQRIAVTDVVPGDVVAGGYNGWLEDSRVYSRALNQDEIKAFTEVSRAYVLSDDQKAAGDIAALSIPDEIHTDILMPAKSASGVAITWTSSKPEVLSTDGLVNHPAENTEVQLTAKIGNLSRNFKTVVVPRDLAKCNQIKYTFEESDLYNKDGESFLADKSGKNHDARIMGSAVVDGTLNLTANTSTGFSTNGCALAPEGVLKDLRSYTFFMKVNPKHLNKAPRLYDFGISSGNSVFGRANKLTGGVKYNGGSTQMVNSPVQLENGKESYVAFTFDARTKATKIFLNGEEKVSGTNVDYAPCQLIEFGRDTRNYIGRAQWWDTSEAKNNNDYCGLIDDFHVYDIALTAAEIAALANQGNGVEGIAADSRSGKLSLSNAVCAPSSILSFNADCASGSVLEIVNIDGILHSACNVSGTVNTFTAPATPGYYIVILTSTDNTRTTARLLVK